MTLPETIPPGQAGHIANHEEIAARILAAEEALEAAAGDRSQTTVGSTIQVKSGFSGNAIASDVLAATILGGGSINRENIIGGDHTQIGTFATETPSDTPNVPQLGSVANYSVIGGGYDNIAGGLASVILGEHNATALGTTHGSLGGGSWNWITAGDYGRIGGGNHNSLSASYACIAGGWNNVASGVSTFVAGQDNIASGAAAVALGSGNVSSGAESFTWGQVCSAEGNYSEASGKYARARSSGQRAQASGRSATSGDVQFSTMNLWRTTTDATLTNLGVAGGATSHNLLDSQSVTVRATIIGRSSAGIVASFVIEGAAGKEVGVNSAILGTPSVLTLYNPNGVPLPTLTAGSSAGAIKVNVTGIAATTILWSCRLELTEVLL